MGSPSTIDLLPEDILDQLQALLRDKRCLQLEVTAQINAMLAEQGSDERVSKSAVNRYALKMKETGAKLAQSREMAKMWIGKLGATPQGQVGLLVNEILRTLAFDISLKLQDVKLTEKTMPEVVSQLRHLSLVAMRLEKAASENVKRESEIREQAKQEAAAAAEKVAKKGGLSTESVQELRRAILGVRA